MKRIVYAFCLSAVLFSVAMVYRAKIVADNSRIRIDFQSNVPHECYFEENSAAVTEECREVLNTQARWLKKYPQFSVVISGYAAKAENDEDTSAEYAFDLGKRRAAMVAEYLVSQGIALRRISSVSYGQGTGAEENAIAGERVKMRKTETVLDFGK